MNQNLWTLAKITVATATTLSILAVPYRWHKNHRTAPDAPTPVASTFTLLAAPEDDSLNTIATGISNRGDVVGVAFDAEGKTVQGFHVKDRRFQLLPQPKGADMAFAQAVNDRGDVVGAAISGKSMRAIAWRGGKAAVLDAGKLDSVAASINEKGQIVGTGQQGEKGPFQALLWEKTGAAKKLGEFGANAISENGWIVGTRVQNDRVEGVVMAGGKLQTLPMPSGADAAAAQATNGKDAIVGGALVGDSIRAVVWTRERAIVLEGLTAGRAFATGVNHAGDIVGTSDAGDGQMSATLWRNGKPIDINTKFPAGSGWRAVMASGINSNGIVVGWAVKGDKVGGFMIGPIR